MTARGLATGGLPSAVELDHARQVGCDAVEIGLRWGATSLLEHAAAVLDECRQRGLQPVVVLHVGGGSGWTALDAPDRFRRWAVTVADGLPSVDHWVPLRRPNEEAIRRHLHGTVRSSKDLLRALDHQLAAHVLAAEVLRDADPGPRVLTCSLATHRLYELDALLLDVLDAPGAGVRRDDLGTHLARRRRAHDEAQDRAGAVSPRQRLHRRIARSFVPLEQALPRSISEAYAAGRPTVDRVRRPTADAAAGRAPAIATAVEVEVDAHVPLGVVRVWSAVAEAGS